jgi:hypothetical protein
MSGDFAASRHHIRGMISMVELKGGAQSLGLNGLLQHLLAKLLKDERLFRMNFGPYPIVLGE